MAGDAGGLDSTACKRCKNGISLNTIKCINCNNIFHPSCAKLYGKFLEDNTFVFCVNVNSTDDFQEQESEFIEVIEASGSLR